ncbi:MAG: hypothetical protein ACYTFM_01390 [Planctomycetota bacterium]|jgi:hypothetical protein
MTKGIKVVLVVSLLMNVGLIVGFVSFRSFAKSEMFKLAVMTIQAEESLLKNILSELESEDPAKITALKERLRKYIERAEKHEEMLRNTKTIHLKQTNPPQDR